MAESPQKVVLITGASSGIGYAAALAFARGGFHVAGVARRRERLEDLAAEIEELPEPSGNFLPLAGDVADAAGMQRAVAETVRHFGRLDVLVANAGVGHRGPLADAEWAALERLLRTNIDGVLHSIRAVVPAMRQSGGGHIITISSVVANLVSPYTACYAASKAFVTSIAHSLRIELEDDGILVTDFLVGRTTTEFNESRLGEGQRRPSRIPSMRPEQVAEAMVRVIDRPQRTVILRWLDRLIVIGNNLFPRLMGRLAERQYR